MNIKCYHFHTLPICAMFISSLIYAADSHKNANEGIEEIIVSAQQQKRTIQETQHSIEVFTDQDLKRGTWRDFNELLISVPNIEVDPVSGIIIRGVPEDGYGGAISTQLTLIDGAYSPGIRHFWDAKQIEILRGGQSSAGSAIGGTYGILYNPAEFEPGGQLLIGFAPSTEDARVGFAYSGPILEETLAFRLAGYSRENSGFVENILLDRDDWSDRQEKFFRGQLRWLPDDKTDVSVSFLYEDIDLGADHYINQLDPDGRKSFDHKTSIETDPRDRVSSHDLFLRYRTTLDNGLEISAFLSDHRRRTFELSDRDNQPSNGDHRILNVYNRTFGGGSYFFYDTNNWSFRALVYAFMVDIGGDASFFNNLDFDGPGPMPGITFRLRFDFPTDHWWITGSRFDAAYTKDKWSFAGRLSIDAEWADNIRTTMTTRITSTGDQSLDAGYDNFISGFFPEVSEKDDYKSSNINPMIGVTYAFTDDISLGFKWERSFRRGWNQVNGHQGLNVSYDPEEQDEVDIVLRSHFFDGRWIVNSNLFYSKVRDQQLNFCFSNAFLDCHIVNAAKSHKLGLEFSSKALWGDFQGTLSASLLEAEFDEFSITGRDDDADQQVPNSPKWKLAIGLAYEPTGRFFAAFDYTMRPGTTGELGVTTVINDKRNLLNGRIGWRFNRWNSEVSLWARNVTDEKYYTSFEPDSPGGYVGAPREVGLTVTSKW